MTTNPSGPADPRGRPDGPAEFDYAGGEVERPDLVEDLAALVDGDVRFDDYSRRLYATDASAYQVLPVGVVLPASTADVAAVVEYCADNDIAVLPRGGGTSLAGQAVNEAVVVDCTRHLDDVIEVDPDEGTARAQAGAILAELNETAAPHGLKFAPDPAWRDKSTLGGAIGNDSSGAHSLVYGTTDHYVESCEAVLADGTVHEFGTVGVDHLRDRADPDGDAVERVYAGVLAVLDDHADAIRERYPDLERNVSGYNLDRLLAEFDGEAPVSAVDDDGSTSAVDDDATRRVNLARLFAGSEGTLGVVTEATVALEPIPETKAIGLLAYDSLTAAMADVAPILDHDPAAVEVMDDVLLGLARDTVEFGDVVDSLPEGDAVLLVEFYAESDGAGRQTVADLVADRVGDADTAADPNPGAADLTQAPRRATAAMEAHDAERRERFWKARKAGLPILLGRTSDAKHISFIEDCAVPPERLPEYVRRFRAILDDHDTFASFYAHAGPGVLHVRPLIDTKTEGGVEAMASIADDVTDLVVELGGSVSGEHGDGRARTTWNRKCYGDDLWRAFRAFKTAFDPDWLLNPGQVVGYEDDESRPEGTPPRADAVATTDHLRFDPDYEFDAGFEPRLEWETENGFEGMVELCHGCGGCRGGQSTTGGVMCPTFRAAEEEIQSTRGRANALRAAMSGDLDEGEAFDDEFVEEVLDLCVGCKGCAVDCPSEVDMAKLKAEVTAEYHDRNGVDLRTRLFARFGDLAALGSATAPLSNRLPELPGARRLAERLFGIAAERSLPTFAAEPFADRIAPREPTVGLGDARRRALLVPDPHTNYVDPEQGEAAVEVLEAAGVAVSLPEGVGDSGRPAHSKGLLDDARDTAADVVRTLAPRVADGWDVVVVEPSDAVMLQSDYRDLLGGSASAVDDDAVDAVAEATYGVCEYVDTFRLEEAIAFDPPAESLTYHGHCHQKATRKDHHAVGVLRRAGYAVDPLDSTCCGMAGSFGYEAEHHAMSRAIGRLLFDQVAESDGETVVAPGASCRTQLGDRPGADDEPPHPIEKLAEAME